MSKRAIENRLCLAFKVAVIDGVGESAEVLLTVRDADGEVVEELPWPADWPECVDSWFLYERGFYVMQA